MKFPKGFPANGVLQLNGKEYVTHAGLVFLISKAGNWSSTVDHVERVFGEDGLPIYMEVTVTVMLEGNTHTAIADASVANVGRSIQTALPRMAHTRAMNRAIRAALGIAATTAEELTEEGSTYVQPKPAQQPRTNQTRSTASNDRVRNSAAQSKTASKCNPGECPHCQSGVYDNRESRSEKQPKWKCKNRDCPSPGKYPWGSYDDWPREWGPAPQAETQPDAAFDDGLNNEPNPVSNNGEPYPTDDSIPF